MYRSLTEIGSLVIDIDGDTLQGTFVRGDGLVNDYFTIVKNETVRIVGFNIDQGTAALSWTSIPGKHYQLEITSDLAGEWTPAGDEILASSEITRTSHSTAGAPQLFYRVVQVD